MENEKKFWFLKLSYRIWIPISWEGWFVIIAFTFALFLIRTQSGLAYAEPFNLARHWPIFLKLGVAIVIFLWVSRGHVKERN